MSASTTAGYYIGFNSPDAFIDTAGFIEMQWSPWRPEVASLFDFLSSALKLGLKNLFCNN